MPTSIEYASPQPVKRARLWRVTIVFVTLATTYFLVAPLSGSADGTLGGAVRSQWGLLAYLAVTTNLSMYEMGNVMISRQLDWRVERVAATVCLLIGLWTTAWLFRTSPNPPRGLRRSPTHAINR